MNPHVYGWTQAPQACLSTDSSTPAYAYALVKCMSYYNRYARNVNHKFSTQVDFFVFLSAALFKAVAEGVTAFTDIAVVGSRRGEVNRQITSPCGVCRQALFEFGGPELNVIMAKTPEDFIERSMDELLPFGFGPSNVAGNSAVEGK